VGGRSAREPIREISRNCGIGTFVGEGVSTPSTERSGKEVESDGLPCADAIRMGRILSGIEPRLTAVARRLLRDPEAASDVVQNAFEKVLRRCEQFRGTARPSTWMHRIVNEALMWLRTEKRRAALRIDPEDWELYFARAGDPERDAAIREERARLGRALARLTAAEREILAASALEGRSYECVGREMGLSAGALKSRAFRARRRLGEKLGAP
jgi:RNA polymerase sigma factor (sigma-70 family)